MDFYEIGQWLSFTEVCHHSSLLAKILNNIGHYQNVFLYVHHIKIMQTAEHL
jgi:hypothetical protein